MASSTSGAAFLFTPDSPPASGGTLPENPHTPTPAPRVGISGTSAMLTTPGSDMSDWVPNDLAMASPTVFDNFPDLSTPQTSMQGPRPSLPTWTALPLSQLNAPATPDTSAPPPPYSVNPPDHDAHNSEDEEIDELEYSPIRPPPPVSAPALPVSAPASPVSAPASPVSALASPSPLVPDFSTSSWRDIPGHPWPQAQRLPLPLQGYSPDDADDDSASVKGGVTRPGADEIDNVGMQDVGMQDVGMQDVGMQDVEMQDDDAQDDDQVGGGRRRLRTRIKLTSRAGPDMVHVAGLRAGLRPSTPPPTIDPAILESPLRPDPPSSSPLPSASTALPAPPPARPFPPSPVPSITSAPTPFPPPPIHTSPSFRLAIEEEATDAFADGPVEMGVDASVEMGADASVEMGADASGEMGADASVEMGVDASGEMGADASAEMRADASDAADDFSDGDEVESPRRGRPDKTTLDAVAACHAAMDALVKNCALATGLSQEKILCSYHHAPTRRVPPMLGTSIKDMRTHWRIGLKSCFVSVPTPAGKDPRALTPDEVKAAWPLFRKAYGKEHTQLLDDWEALERLSNEISIGTRHRQFTRTTRDIIGMLKKFAMKFGFHSLFIMTGSYLNEDGKLAVLHSTGLLSTLRSDLNDHDVVALAKLAAYTEEIGFTLLGGDEDAQMADVSVASRAEAAAASVGKAEKVYKGRNTPQPEVIDLTTLPVKKREQVLRQSRHQKSVDDTHSLQDIMTGASNEDVGVDIYREKSGRSKVFGWRRLDVILSEGDFIIKNFPASVRHPAQMPATRATSAWRVAERDALRTALAARTGGPHQGLRVERRKYEPGAVVIYSHDYTLTPPEGPPDSPLVRKFWRSSNGAPVNCTDGNRAVWHMQYDLDAPLQHTPRTLVQAGAEAGLNDEEEQEDSDEDSPAPENGRGKAKDKGKGKEKEKVKRKRKDADKDEEATMPTKRAKKTAPRATSTRPVPAQAPMQEGGGHRGSAMRDLDGDRADNGEDTLPRPLKSALAGSRSESQRKDQSVRWDIAEHSWLREDEDQPLQDLKRRLESRHTTADPAAMPVDDGNESELTPLPSPRPQPLQEHDVNLPTGAVWIRPSGAKRTRLPSLWTTATSPNSPRRHHLDLGPNPYHRRVVQLQEHDVNLPIGGSADMSVGRQVDSSAKHKADTSGGHERVPAASTTLPPTSITRRVTRSSTTATAASSSSAGPPQAVAGPSKPSKKWQTGSVNAVASSSKLPPTDSGTLYSIKNPQPIGRWYEVDNAVFGRLGMKGPVEPPADDAAFGAPPPPANNTNLGAPPPPANDTALGAPPLASFGPPGPLLSAVLSAGLPTTSVGPTAPALPTPSALIVPAAAPAATPIVPAAPPIVPAAPAVPFDPAAVVSAVAQIDQFMAAFKGYSIEDIAAALQNIKK
ncbi:hypothetical protein B0H14DRAFT_2647185 [Mycena olivaceomarginata]|nr:hypothetical protein B0H14DRAFT_2647185 [Mycena olivaceomarginata]